MEIKKDYSAYDLLDELWSGAEITMQKIINEDKEDEFFQLMKDEFCGEIPTITEINDYLRFDDTFIFKSLGMLDEDEDEE